MAVRLTSVLQAFDGASWTPTDETVLQLGISAVKAGVGVVVQVQGRVSADAPWQTLDTLTQASLISGRVAKLPFLRLSMQGNIGGGTVTVWDNT